MDNCCSRERLHFTFVQCDCVVGNISFCMCVRDAFRVLKW